MNDSLSWSERRHFLQLLNSGGYVLNFSTDSFDRFTDEIIGVPLCKKYGLSKGKSLEAFLSEATRADSIKLLEALLNEWNATRKCYVSEDENHLANVCAQDLINLKKISIPFDNATNHLKNAGFSSQYLDSRTQALNTCIQEGKPTEAIGISKELVESCCKTILEESGTIGFENDNIPRLVKKTMELLDIGIDKISEQTPEPDAIRKLLGSLSQTVSSLAELRNEYGTGHGKSKSYQGLAKRHARLAGGASLAIVQYLWDTFCERIKN